MQIIKTTLPNDSMLNVPQPKLDHTDSFLGELSGLYKQIDICDIGKAFFSGSPKWVEKLFWLSMELIDGIKHSWSNHLPEFDDIPKSEINYINANYTYVGFIVTSGE